MKKLLLLLCVILTSVGLASAEQKTFVKVTDYSTLSAGDQIIFILSSKTTATPAKDFNMIMKNATQGKNVASRIDFSAPYGDEVTLDVTDVAVITLEESNNSSYPWYMACTIGEAKKYVTSTATSSANGLAFNDAASNAAQIVFGTSNFSFNNSSASSRKYLRANITNAKAGEGVYTSGASNLGKKPEVYRLKVSTEVTPGVYACGLETELTLTVGDEKTLVPATPAPSVMTWSSDNEDVVSVEEGKLTAKAVGTATVTLTWAADDNFQEGSHNISVTVKEATPEQFEGTYKLVTSISDLTDSDYYILAANCSGNSDYYALSTTFVPSDYIQGTPVNVSADGSTLELTDECMIFNIHSETDEKGNVIYLLYTISGDKNDYVYGSGSNAKNKYLSIGQANESMNPNATIQIASNGAATIKYPETETSRQILYQYLPSNNNCKYRFNFYASSNLTGTNAKNYGVPRLYKFDGFVPAAKPIIRNHENAQVGTEVEFAPKHRSHTLEYYEWSLTSSAQSAASMREAEAEKVWNPLDNQGDFHHFVVREYNDKETQYGIDVRARDIRDGVSEIQPFAWVDGKGVTLGIENVIADYNAEVEYYNLQGVRVANPENGIYIRRQGSKVEKVIVK